MVMPRSRSMSIESRICSLPAISRASIAPVSWISRSASVDLPWSICATIEKLRMLWTGAAVMACGLSSHVPMRQAQGQQRRLDRRSASECGIAFVTFCRLGALRDLGQAGDQRFLMKRSGLLLALVLLGGLGVTAPRAEQGPGAVGPAAQCEPGASCRVRLAAREKVRKAKPGKQAKPAAAKQD